MEAILTPPKQTMPAKTSYRFGSIDLLRGLVMIIMALDHTRDFFHETAFTQDPLNLETTTPALFFTRWITHFCAPVFVFLAGSSAWFQGLRKTKKDLSLFLIKRGIWLIIVEAAIMSLIFTFDIEYKAITLATIWAIGISMVILGLAILLPFPLTLAIGILIVFGHNALDFYEKNLQTSPGFFYDLMHRVSFYPLDNANPQDHTLVILYPFLSWTGLMLLGYCFGKLFTSYDGTQRKKILLWTGFVVIAIFIIVRALNIYGNPEKWEEQDSFFYTFLSFIDTHKYPPSLLYMCMTIGPGIIFLAMVNNTDNRLSRLIKVYGRVPFFYYVLHFFVIHLVSTIIFFLKGNSLAAGIHNELLLPNFVIPREGFSLGVTYLFWIGIVAALYPVCKWYDRYKSNHREKWWLSYL